MRIFASEKVSTLMQKLGMEKGEAIEHNWVNKAISNAQKKVEGHNFDIRKHLLDYDNVANEQRKHIYNKRNEFLDIKDREEIISLITEEVFIDLIESNINLGTDSAEIDAILQRDFNIKIIANNFFINTVMHKKKGCATFWVCEARKMSYNVRVHRNGYY